MPRRGVGYVCVCTYGESTELPGTTLLEDGHDLGDLAGDAENAAAGLEDLEGRHAHDGLGEQSGDCRCQAGDEEGSLRRLATIVQHQGADDDVLDRDHRRLAIGTEGELVAEVVREGDQHRTGLEEVGEERNARG